jgi:hypothetical protein
MWSGWDLRTWLASFLNQVSELYRFPAHLELGSLGIDVEEGAGVDHSML